MTGRRFEKLARTYLLPKMTDYQVQNGIIFSVPVTYIVRGFFVNSSAFHADEFCICLFIHPLFVPDQPISASLGGRLGSILGKQEKWWTLTNENEPDVMSDILQHMRREGPTIFDRFKTLKDFVERTSARQPNPHSPYPPEMAAYGAILLDDPKTVDKMFRRLGAVLDEVEPEHQQPYHDEIRARAKSMHDAFARDPSEAKAILHQWRDATVAKLKLTRYIEASLMGDN